MQQDLTQVLTAIAALTLELQNTSRAQQQQSFEMASALTNTNNQISSAQQNILNLQEAIQAINNNIQDLRSVDNPANRPSTPQINLDLPQTLVRHTTESFRSDYKLISSFEGTHSLQEINDWASAVREYLELFPDLQLPLAKHFITSRLKGFARTWYQNHLRMVQKQQRIDFTTWPSLLHEIVQAALAGQNPNGPRNTFRELAQTVTVPEFVKEFNNVYSLLQDRVTEDEACDRFLTGLKPKIRSAVYTKKLVWTILEDLQLEAIRQEIVVQAARSAQVPNTFGHGRGKPTSGIPNPVPNALLPKPTDPAAMDVDAARLQKITDAERAHLAAHNGCFRCRQVNADHTARNCPKNTRNVNNLEKGSPPAQSAATFPTPEIGVNNLEDDRYSLTDIVSKSKTSLLGSNYYYCLANEINDISILVAPKPVPPHSVPKQTAKQPRDSGNWMLNPTISAKIFAEWGTPAVDLFATHLNKKAPFYYRAKSAAAFQEGCLGENAFAFDWTSPDLYYANPPWADIDRAIAKVKQDKTKQMIFIAPCKSKQLRALSTRQPIRISHDNDTFIPESHQPSNKGVGKPHWTHTYAYFITGDFPDVVPSMTKRDSRFVFNAHLRPDGSDKATPGTILADSGCNTNVVSADFVRRHNLTTYPVESCHLTFGNGTKALSTEETIIAIERTGYVERIAFIVAAIKYDAILGTPWFESVTIDQLDWHSRTFQFHRRANGSPHDWSHIEKPRLQQVVHCNMQEITRDTEWLTYIPIEEILFPAECATIFAKEGLPAPRKNAYNFQSPGAPPEKESLVPKSMLDQLLSKHSSVFEEPDKLPPSRPEDHRILLDPAFKFPPWRPLGILSQYELQVLKERLTELLDKGFITHSSSPFGANILFAKKKTDLYAFASITVD